MSSIKQIFWAASHDQFGRIERRGIDQVPDAERRAIPRDLAWVFFGTQLAYGSLVVGALPVVFGLGWRAP